MGEFAAVFYMCYSVACALPDFETEANRDSRSTFERVSFPGKCSQSSTIEYFSYWPAQSPSPYSYTGSVAGRYACLFIFRLWSNPNHS
jgi:hypothetical protein